MASQLHEDVKQLMRGTVLQTREKVSLSQEKMAPYLGVTSRSLSNIEGGTYCCSLDTFLLYCFNFRDDMPLLFQNIFDIIEHSVDDRNLFFESTR